MTIVRDLSELRPLDWPPLPPDPERMNDHRAAWAEEALDAFAACTGTDGYDTVPDLLCDIMHFMDRAYPNGKQRFEEALSTARASHAEETASPAFKESHENAEGDYLDQKFSNDPKVAAKYLQALMDAENEGDIDDCEFRDGLSEIQAWLENWKPPCP